MDLKDHCLEVMNIIMKDDVALEKWNTVKDSLIMNPADRLKLHELFNDRKYHEAILQTIKLWCSQQTNPDWEQFIDVMKKNGLNHLAGKLKSKLQTGKETGCIWFEVNEVPYNFTDRLTDMETLHGLMLKSREKHLGIGQLVAVTGLGGIGKSTLCSKYAYDQRLLYQNVIWIHAETSDSMESSFQRLYTHLGMARSQDISIEDLVKAVYEYFSNKSCLFIFDNLEELSVLNPFRPKLNPWLVHPFILITSRIKDIVHINMLLNTLTEAEASSFVLKGVENSTKSDAQEVVKLLEYLPLALQQAVAYIREKFVDSNAPTLIQKYIARFKTSAASLLNDEQFHKLNGYEKRTYTTWNVTLEQIKSKNTTAVDLLEVLSFLNPARISLNFLRSIMQENQLEDALMVLRNYSMISLESGIIRIHRLVQNVVLLGLSEDRRTQIVTRIVQVIPDVLKDYKFTDLVRESVSHGLYLAMHQDLSTMPSMYLNNLCWYLVQYGNYADSLDLSSKAAQHFTKLSGPNHLDTLRMRWKMGCAHLVSRNASAALEILENIYELAIANTEIGKEHPLTLDVQQTIASAYVYTDPEKSLGMYNELIPIMERVLGKEHRRLITAISNKASAMTDLGRLDEALTSLKLVYDMRVFFGDADNVIGLTTKYKMANVLYKMGDLDHALPIFKEVFEGHLNQLGETHPKTIKAQGLITEIEIKLNARQGQKHLTSHIETELPAKKRRNN